MTESIASEVLSASLGGAISASVLYPLEVLKTKMQAETKKSHEGDDYDEEEDRSSMTMVEYAQHLYKKQGAQVFFAGVETSAFQSATEKALYFFAYTGLKSLYRSFGDGGDPQTFASLLLGCCAEWAHLPITLPLDCWTTAIQTNTDVNKGPMQLLLTMLSEKGLGGMYKGIQAYTVLCLKPALQYTIFERVKAIMVAASPTKNRLNAAESFFLGMIARTISTICIFPYIRAKVVLQTSRDTAAAGSIPEILGQMYRQGGIAAWFQGLGPELTRGVLSSALMLMIKEQIGQLVQTALDDRNTKRGSTSTQRQRLLARRV